MALVDANKLAENLRHLHSDNSQSVPEEILMKDLFVVLYAGHARSMRHGLLSLEYSLYIIWIEHKKKIRVSDESSEPYDLAVVVVERVHYFI